MKNEQLLSGRLCKVSTRLKVVLSFFIIHSSLFILFAGCTRHETLPYTPPTATPVWPVEFDNIRAEIKGLGHEVIATVSFEYEGGNIDLAANLPQNIPADQLCKVARETQNDYEGYWPARECSDRDAKVAALGDIIAYRGDEKVGRLYLTSWDGHVATEKGGSYMGYFHYADRPFTLSGTNHGSLSFVYDVAFEAGWNLYVNRYGGHPSYRNATHVTNLPADIALRWEFESWQ
jgi:hypothetical protein